MPTTYRHALCLHPYFRDSRSGSLGMAVFPPIGLEYIAAALRPYVTELTFLDLRLPGPLRNACKLQRFIQSEIDLLCISINWEYHFNEVCELVRTLPAGITTIVGGKQATDYLEEVFQSCPDVDIVVRGEGEEAIAEIASGKDLKDIQGISFRQNGRLVNNPNRPVRDVNTYSFPDRSLRKRKYHFNLGGFALRGEEFDVILTSRGCPYNCKFCTFSLGPWGQKRYYSARTIDSVIEELKEMSAGVVLISDENFFVDPDRAKEICERMMAEGIKKRFLAQSRIEIYRRPDVLEAAARAGVKVLLLGIESPTDRILEQLNKGFDTAEVRKAFETFRQWPFYYHGYFIYGNVNETDEEMMQIPVFAIELGLDSITYQKLRADRYSPLRELVQATPGYFVGDDNGVYSDRLLYAGLVRISKRITRKFYTPRRLSNAVVKVFRLRLFTLRVLPIFLAAAPFLLGSMILREINKAIRRFLK